MSLWVAEFENILFKKLIVLCTKEDFILDYSDQLTLHNLVFDHKHTSSGGLPDTGDSFRKRKTCTFKEATFSIFIFI